MTLTFYREATLHDLRVLVSLVCIYVVVINCIRRVSQIRRVLGAIAIIGVVFAVLALIQDAIGLNKIYGIIEPQVPVPVVRGGPFINRNHFGQFMNLSVGAAIGLGLVLINQHFRRDDYSPGEVARKLKSEEMRPAWVLLGIVVLCMAAVALSLSRGAMLGAAIAGLITGAILVTRPGAHGRIWIIAAVVVCVALVILLKPDQVVGRLLEAGDAQGPGRIEILRGISHAVPDYPVFGSGLGTFAVVFPQYDWSNVPMFASHAENEYAQLLMETGAIGAFLALVFLAMVIWVAIRSVLGALSPASSAVIGLIFSLLAILFQSAFDFGQHIPAVAGLTTVICALIINLGQLRQRELDRVSSTLPSRGHLFARIGGLLALIAVGSWIGIQCAGAITADRAWRVARRIDRYLLDRNWKAPDALYFDIITAAQEASNARPGNIEYHYWLNFYRWKSVMRDLDANGRPQPEEVQHFPRIVEELHAGRWLCQTHGPTYLLASEIESYLPDRAQQSTEDLRRAYLLSGPDPVTTFLMGQLDAREGDMTQAMVKLRRAAELDRTLIPDVIDVCIRQIGRPDLALQLAADDLDALSILSNALSADPATKALADQARDRAFAALEAKAHQPDAPAELQVQLADALEQRERYEEAIPLLRRALNFDYGKSEWRLRLARVLARLGRYDEARRELDILLQRREMKEALELRDSITKSSATQKTK
jgi:tetratricopeptide (TPR) repeat protein